MCLPRLGTEPGDVGQAAGREVIEEASVSSLRITGLLTASSCCVTLCELLTLSVGGHLCGSALQGVHSRDAA